MEQDNKNTNTTDTTNQQNTAQQAQAPSGGAGAGSGQTMEQLMEQSPMLAPFSGWLKCLRKPALSMEYSFQKRHIPDLDQDGQTSSPASVPAAGQSKGKNSDTMGINGSFTIRYFDFALGIVGLALAGCMAKGFCCLKRKMF